MMISRIFFIYITLIISPIITYEERVDIDNLTHVTWVSYSESRYPDENGKLTGERFPIYILLKMNNGKFSKDMISPFAHIIGTGSYEVLPGSFHPTMITLIYNETDDLDKELRNSTIRYYVKKDSLFDLNNNAIYFRDSTYIDPFHIKNLVCNKWIVPTEEYSDYIIFYPDTTYIFYDSILNEYFNGNYELEHDDLFIYDNKIKSTNSDGEAISQYKRMSFIHFNNKLLPQGRILVTEKQVKSIFGRGEEKESEIFIIEKNGIHHEYDYLYDKNYYFILDRSFDYEKEMGN